MQQYTPKAHIAAYTESSHTGAAESLLCNKREVYMAVNSLWFTAKIAAAYAGGGLHRLTNSEYEKAEKSRTDTQLTS
jgi:hypothetical protein